MLEWWWWHRSRPGNRIALPHLIRFSLASPLPPDVCYGMHQARETPVVLMSSICASNHYGGLDSKMDTAAGLKRMQRLTEFLLSMSIYKLDRSPKDALWKFSTSSTSYRLSGPLPEELDSVNETLLFGNVKVLCRSSPDLISAKCGAGTDYSCAPDKYLAS